MDLAEPRLLSVELTNRIIQDYVQRKALKPRSPSCGLISSAVSGCIAFTYYVLTTIDQEVSEVWPQKHVWGKVLFLTTRYFTVLSDIGYILFLLPLPVRLSTQVCNACHHISLITYFFANSAAEATFVVCLYALLKARRMYLLGMAAIYVTLAIPIIILIIMGFQKAHEPETPLQHLLFQHGYSCYFRDPSPNSSTYRFVAAVVMCTGTAMAAVLGFVTLAVSYRRHNGSLIKVIRRDGGMYYLSAFSIWLIYAIAAAPGPVVRVKLVSNGKHCLIQRRLLAFPKINDKFRIINILVLIIPILSNKLLLDMKRAEDPGTRNIVSTLLFDPINPEVQFRSYKTELETRQGVEMEPLTRA